jgi:hypothetical protein
MMTETSIARQQQPKHRFCSNESAQSNEGIFGEETHHNRETMETMFSTQSVPRLTVSHIMTLTLSYKVEVSQLGAG